MAVQDMIIVALVVSALTIFGSVLGFASWSESRHARRARK